MPASHSDAQMEHRERPRASGSPSGDVDRFGHLIAETCRLTGVSPVSVWLDRVPAGLRVATFRVSDIECTLSHRADSHEHISVHCVFGVLHGARRADGMLALLQMNLAMHGSFSSTFAMDPEHHVVLCMSLPLQDLQADALMHILENLAMQALGWRKAWLDSD